MNSINKLIIQQLQVKKCEWNSPLKEVQNLVIRAPSVNKWEHNEHKFVWKYHKEEG